VAIVRVRFFPFKGWQFFAIVPWGLVSASFADLMYDLRGEDFSGMNLYGFPIPVAFLKIV